MDTRSKSSDSTPGATVLACTAGDGVHGSARDRTVGAFPLSPEDSVIPERAGGGSLDEAHAPGRKTRRRAGGRGDVERLGAAQRSPEATGV